MKQITKIIAAIIAFSLFFSCDKIDHPLQEGNIIVDNGDTTVVKRRVLIEEFTGHYCTNCPQGAVEAHRLDSVYGEQVIPVSIHSDPTFAVPHTGSGSYETDFRTPDGDIYYSTFGVNGIPKALISRLDGGSVSSLGQWESKVLSIIDTSPLAEVTIETSYNTTTRQVTANIKTEWLLNGGSDNYRLQVYLIEDHITDWQLNNGVDIPNYDHRHVLRAVINTTWGEAISSSTQGSKDNKSYTYTLAGNWNEDNCEIVAFVYKESPNYEVIQANIHHVK
jgi:hypothetical protein